MTRSDIQLVRSLSDKRGRSEHGLFVAEGAKLIGELRRSNLRIRRIFATEGLFEGPEVECVTEKEMERLSLLKTPSNSLAIVEIPRYRLDAAHVGQRLTLALDDVQNPGNLGTIIRLADWFGIRHVFCSIGTADAYNPKTVQATMGALARVRIHYCDLKDLIGTLPDMPVYGTFLDGKNIYGQELTPHGLIVMGNEGKGISQEMEKLVNKRLLIPNYPQGEETSESLNVATATAIVCAEFRRRML